MKKPLSLLLFIVLSVLFCTGELYAQQITRVDGLPLNTPICLNTDYELQIISQPPYTSCSNGSTLTYVWHKDSGVGDVTFTPVPGFPNRTYARFTSPPNNLALRVNLMCGAGTIVAYFGGTGVTTVLNPPTVSPSVSRCGSGTITLQATPSAGNSIRWYSSSGTLVSSSSTYSPSVSSTTTFYAASYNASGGCIRESARVAVLVTINTVPDRPTTSSVTRCGPGSATLNATPASGGTTCRWYTSIESHGQILPLADGNSFTTPSLTTTTLYYVSTVNVITGCVSGYQRVQVTVVSVTVPTATNATTRCGAGSVTFTAVPASGATIYWYASASAPSPIATGSSFTTTVSATTTYYAANYYSASGCESTRIPVTATINPIPAPPDDIDYVGSPCNAGTVATVVPGLNATTCRWYTSSSAPNSVYTGTSYTLPALTTYYVSSYNPTTGCESTARAAVGCAGSGRMPSPALSAESDNENEEILSVYPNPSATGSFTIVASKTIPAENVIIQVLDREGKVRINQACQEENFHLNASLPAGIYLVKLTGKTFSRTKRLIVL